MSATIQELTDAWLAAEQGADPIALSDVLAENFANVGPFGFVLDKPAYVNRYASGDLQNHRFDLSDISIRQFGDTAILICTSQIEMRWRGEPRQGQYRMTQVLVHTDGDWKIAGMHTSQIPGDHA